MNSKGTILTTGGAGYVGSHVAVELLNSDYSVIAIDNFVNSCSVSNCKLPESLKRVQDITGKTLKFYNANLCDKEVLNSIFKKHTIDCVIHFAALKSVGQSCQTPVPYYYNNLTGATILLQVMEENNVKQMIFSSSSTVYGTPDSLPVTEKHPTGRNCTNPYGKSKYFVEEILKDVCSSDPDWKVISLRYFNPVGAHKSGLIGEDSPGIPRNIMPFISQVAVGRRENVQIFGGDYDTPDGTPIRDYTHIVDLATGHINALEKMAEPMFAGWEAYNMGAGKGYSVLEVIHHFSKVCGKDIKYEIGSRRKGDITRNYSDSTKAKHELNWTTTKDIIDMCRDAWNWQSQNPNGYKKNITL